MTKQPAVRDMLLPLIVFVVALPCGAIATPQDGPRGGGSLPLTVEKQ